MLRESEAAALHGEVVGALVFGGFLEGALFEPREAVHPLRADLGQDRIDVLLLFGIPVSYAAL